MIEPGERGVAVIERQMSEVWQVGIGSEISLRPPQPALDREATLTVVGLFDSQRIAEFQYPYVYVALDDLQEFVGEPGAVTAIDVMLEDTSPEALARAQESVETLIRERNLSFKCKVETAASRQMVLDEADRVTRMTLMLIAFVALLTAFFIIVTTMSMSLFERRTMLGVMRCVGLTRGQLAGLLFLELVPLGVVGTAVGLGAGVGLTRMVEHWSSEVLVDLYLSRWGMSLAAASGIITTLVSASILAIQICRVTPLAAVNLEARAPRIAYLYLSGVFGLLLIGVHELMMSVEDMTRWMQTAYVGVGTCSLYLGYALVAPTLVVMLGPTVARLVAPLMGLRATLAEDQFGRSPWRSTGVCWMLMVGLSHTIYIGIGGESLLAIWDFPARLPETFLWTRDYVSGETLDRVRKLPGVGAMTAVVDVDCQILTPDADGESLADSLVGAFLRKLTRPVFVAGDPDQLLSMVKVTFDEGSMEDALEKLRRGGYALIPTQTARNKKLHLGDRVTVGIKERSADFEIAGVIQSPVLDMTVNAFQATSYMDFASAAAIIGTRKDLKAKFDLDAASMVMCDLNLPESEMPEEFYAPRPPDRSDKRALTRMLLRWSEHLPNEQSEIERIRQDAQAFINDDGESRVPAESELGKVVTRYRRALRRSARTWDRDTPEQRWWIFRERLVLWKMAEEMDRPEAILGSMRRLKEGMDRIVRRAVITLTWLPSIILVVAAIGVGNLMMVSVQIRSRQIAVLRSIGAVKSQIIRLVLAEAISLGLLGSVIGMALGAHLALSDSRITGALIGFQPELIIPIGTVTLGIALTLMVCLGAGIIPARYAARNNIIAAMQTT
jgi:ABC-type lipoprotein release transport system permease subunit